MGVLALMAIVVAAGIFPIVRGSFEPALGGAVRRAATTVINAAQAVKQRKLFFMCRFYGFCQRNHACGADHYSQGISFVPTVRRIACSLWMLRCGESSE
jgi:hypothetical protein